MEATLVAMRRWPCRASLNHLPNSRGGRPGWLYKRGPMGTGYYRARR